MADTTTMRTRIDEIDAILAAGVSSSEIEGRKVTYDLRALRDERARLLRSIASAMTGSSSSMRRVVFKNG